MVSKRILLLTGVALGAGAFNASAQQPLPRPIVLYRPVQYTNQYGQPNQPAQVAQPVSPPMTQQALDRQWAYGVAQPRGPVTINTNATSFSNTTPNTARPNAVQPAVVNGIGNQGAQVSQTGSQQNGQSNQADSQGLMTEQQWEAEQKSRPTLQAMQNPSGAMNMTHNGFTNGQQVAPNTYLGAQFQNWQNQQPVSQSSAAVGELYRMQPGPFGGYVGPNTFVGTGFSTWSNMTQGGISAGATGSWDFSIWP
ncbi:MAG: hypothetical protein JWP89_5626 [Schlesneria sp.]|nr:hypothetical protein [Schlesneria sp.]